MPVTIERALFQQLGKQTVFDTAVPATFRYLGQLVFTENVDYYVQPFPQRVRGPVSGQMVNVRNGWVGKYTSEATYEEIISALLATVKGGVTATGVGADKTWTFTLPHASDPAPNYYTLEYALNDWTTSYGRQVPNVLGSQLRVIFPINAPARLEWDMFGGKVAVATPTAALANLTGREVAKGNSTKVYLDGSGAGIGTTLISGNVLSAELLLHSGMRPDFTLDGRANLDYGKYLYGDILGTLKLLLEYDGNANTEVANWRAGTKRFARLIVTGSLISALNKTIQLDVCVEWDRAVVLGQQGGNDVVTLEGNIRYDATWAKMGVVTIINALATAT